jgi:dipeptidyl aminopeptidase/acylaminoacyl peptidase
MYSARYWAAIALAWLALPCAQAKDRKFTVKDDISMVRFTLPRADPNVPGSQFAQPSPDGRSIAIVTTQGLLSKDEIESRLLLFKLDAIERAVGHPGQAMPKPTVLATIEGVPPPFAAVAHSAVIKDVRWSADSSTIYFLAANRQGNYRLCRVRRNGSGFENLTPTNENVNRFSVTGNTIVFTAASGQPSPHAVGQNLNRDARDITGTRLVEDLFPDSPYNTAERVFRLYTLRMSKDHPSIHRVPNYSLEQIPYLTAFYPFAVSPDAHQIIKLEPTPLVLASWSRYAPVEGYGQLRLKPSAHSGQLRADNVLRPLEYTLINLANGQKKPLLDAPSARSLGYTQSANLAVWSKDGRRVLISNTFLPIPSDDTGQSGNLYPCGVVSVDLPSMKARCLYVERGSLGPAAFHLQDVAFGDSPDRVEVLLHNRLDQQIARNYVLHTKGWSLAKTIPLTVTTNSLRDFAHPQKLKGSTWKVYVHQGLNDPPMLWVTAPDARTQEVWNPNPDLLHLRFGHASLYRWKDKTGRFWSAILVKPVGYIPGNRYPLVLQMYGYVDHQFITDGLYPIAFAARELASAGFMVLQIRKQPDTGSELDPQIALDGYRSAVANLTSAGMVDPKRVGVVGYSLTCWYAAYALVHDPNLFSAAVIADGLDNSYMQFKLFAVGDYPLLRQMLKVRGVAPFGPGLTHWVKAASAFHFDKIQAPVRIEAIGPPSVLQEWDLYSSLRFLRKPVDMIYFPNGTHILQRPLERLESQQATVEWMRLWLEQKFRIAPARQAKSLHSSQKGLRTSSLHIVSTPAPQ